MAENRLGVFLDGTPAGTLEQHRGGRLTFTYLEGYATQKTAIPLSLSMPLTLREHGHRVVLAFLAGLLPDSPSALALWARKYHVSAENPFALLRHVGRDAAGAVQVLPDGQQASDAASRQGDIEWLPKDSLRQTLRELAVHTDDWNSGRDTGRWSLAGAQSKVALFRSVDGQWGIPRDATPRTHILKPSMPGYDAHHLNEHLCLRAARLLGLPAAETELLADDELEVLIATRYDRLSREGRWIRLHQEDLCQALSVHPRQKYQSDGGPGVHAISDLFRSMPAAQRLENSQRFFEYLLYNVAVCASDAHAKNYSILLGPEEARLAPMYDVASILPYNLEPGTQFAMKIGSSWQIRQISELDWASVAKRLSITPEEAIERARSLRAAVPDAFARAAEEELVPGHLRDRAVRIADLVSAHVRGQRDVWDRVDPTARR